MTHGFNYAAVSITPRSRETAPPAPSGGTRAHGTPKPPPIDEDWMQTGACQGMDPNIFHPAKTDSINAIKVICGRCVVSEECLQYALAKRIEHGWWGGRSASERRNLRKGVMPKPRPAPVKIAARSNVSTMHGVAIRRMLSDGKWHTLDEVARVVRPLIKTQGGPSRTARYARSVTATTLHNMRRREPVEYSERLGYRMVTGTVLAVRTEQACANLRAHSEETASAGNAAASSKAPSDTTGGPLMARLDQPPDPVKNRGR